MTSSQRLALTLGVVLFCACDTQAPVACGADNCLGCCVAAGLCQAGVITAACGRAGVACFSCSLGLTCAAGTCVTPNVGGAGGFGGGGAAGGNQAPACTPDTCLGCCDTAGRCQAGLITTACGRNGAACVTCSTGLTCSSSTCVTSNAGGGTGGSGGGGTTSLEALVNRTSCDGTGQLTGTAGGQVLRGTAAVAQVTTYGTVSTSVYAAPITTGTRVFIVEFTPTPGQLDYSSANARCGIGERTSSGWVGVEHAAACEVQLAALQFSSAAGVCDGITGGRFQALFSGNSIVEGAFAVPLQSVFPTSTRCHSSGDTCSSDSNCCSQSCSPALGLCN